jgi:hypothetical protein
MENEPRGRTLVIPLNYLVALRACAEESVALHEVGTLAHQKAASVAYGVNAVLTDGFTVNLPARQIAALAETLRPIVETDWQAKDREQADFTPSGVNG